MRILGVDTGGTFTDFVYYCEGELQVHKVLSTPAAPEKAILQGISELNLDLHDLKIIHGSTVATNAVLEGKGVKTVYVTNRGLKDVLLIGRQARRELYNLQPLKPRQLINRNDCLETGGRLSAKGEVVDDLTEQDIDDLVQQIQQCNPESVAINLLFSFLNPDFEKRLEAAMPGHLFVSRSSNILPEYKEYERGITTWFNAYIGPLVQRYLKNLSDKVTPAKVSVMQSSGGTASAEQAGIKAVNMLLSGPAGGLQAAKFVGNQIDENNLLTFDMGGTSTDVALIQGEIKLSSESIIIGLPVAVPMVDMHTIGAGGGSIAYIDDGGLLQVGPESAGAAPGPACYMQGGVRATVTDANVVLGRLPASENLAGSLSLNRQAAFDAVLKLAEIMKCSVEQAAKGIVRLANEHMAQALRVISVQKGLDPRQYTLICFGGAGALHVCELAETMGMSKAVVPLNSGVFSAFGMLVAPISRELSLTRIGLLAKMQASEFEQIFQQLIEQGTAEMLAERVRPEDVQQKLSLDLRYRGQSFTLNIKWTNIDQAMMDFHATHEQRYGHKLNEPLELVNVRVSLKAQTESLKWQKLFNKQQLKPKTKVQVYACEGEVPVWSREDLAAGQIINGPALITEKVATTFIKTGWIAECDEHGHIILLNKPK